MFKPQLKSPLRNSIMRALLAGNSTPSVPAFTVTLDNLVNLTGGGTTNVFINPATGVWTTLQAAIAAALGGNSTSGTGGITTSASASRSSGVAPCAVFFEATATTNSLGIDSFHDILYCWNFGDGEVAWTYGTGAGDNSKNRARGPVAAHVYETAGTYTAKVTPITVSSGGTLSIGATTSLTTTVAAATRSGTTYVVSSSGNFTGAPAGTQVTTSDINTALGSGRMAANTRFLFKGGETFNLSAGFTVGVSGVTFGAWGAGKPTITHTNGAYNLSISTGVDDIIAMDLSLDAVTSGSGNVRWKTLFGNGASGARSNILMLRIDTNKNSSLFDGGFTDGVFLVECNGQGFTGGSGNVGFYAEHSSRVVLLGSRIYDCTGTEHCVRHQGSTKVIVSNNTIYKPATSKNCVTIRGRSVYATPATWSGVWVENCVVSDNIMDAGTTANPSPSVFIGPQNLNSDERVRNVIVERNYAAGNAPFLGSEVCSGLTVRNNLVLFESTATYPGAVMYISARNTVGTPAGTSSYIYNNSVFEPSGGTLEFSLVAISKSGTLDYATGIVVKNNLCYAPGATTDGLHSGAPAVVIPAALTPAYFLASNNTSNAQITGTVPGFTVPPTSTYTTWKPTAGYGINAGGYVPVFDDFNGAARTGAYDFGGVNP